MTERASLQVGLKPGIARYQQASHKVEMGRNWSSWVGRGGGDYFTFCRQNVAFSKARSKTHSCERVSILTHLALQVF